MPTRTPSARRTGEHSGAHQERLPGELLLGLYQGVPLTERGAGYFGVLPDRIVLFRRPIEARARSDADLAELRAAVEDTGV